MIKLLRISNIAVVNAVEVEFGPRLNLLSGETGAGKSILVDALGLLLGGRASADVIRTGEALGTVEGVLEGAGLVKSLERHGLPVDGEEVIIRREVSATGKGRVSVNGALAPIAVLRDVVSPWVEIHGQHDHKGLLDAESHLPLLDGYAGLLPLAGQVATLHGERARILLELGALRQDRRELMRRREMLEFQAKEIESAALAPDEEEALRAERAVQANAGRLRELAEGAYALLYDDDEAALGRLQQVRRKLEELAGIDPSFEAPLQAWPSVVAPLDDLALQLRRYKERIETKPGRLDDIESRLQLIERLKRKYGASLAEVIAFGARCREELGGFGSPEERERGLEKSLADVRERFLKAAGELSRKRRRAAKEMGESVLSELRELAMEKAGWSFAFDPDPARPDDEATWSARGLETGEFLLSPNPGEEPRPLAKIASGGELSRVLLALESVASRSGEPRSLVFDEVDAGIGGRVAEVVGRRLRALSEKHQVLCVTHLPQIAALADVHFAVSKRVERGRTLTEVAQLDDDARLEEIARMLAGETVTEAARRHAREMMKQSVRS